MAKKKVPTPAPLPFWFEDDPSNKVHGLEQLSSYSHKATPRSSKHLPCIWIQILSTTVEDLVAIYGHHTLFHFFSSLHKHGTEYILPTKFLDNERMVKVESNLAQQNH